MLASLEAATPPFASWAAASTPEETTLASFVPASPPSGGVDASTPLAPSTSFDPSPDVPALEDEPPHPKAKIAKNGHGIREITGKR